MVNTLMDYSVILKVHLMYYIDVYSSLMSLQLSDIINTYTPCKIKILLRSNYVKILDVCLVV